MKRNRYLLCLLLAGLMLYYALPRISLEAPGVEGVFSIAWLALALLVVAGNLSAYLFTPRVSKIAKVEVNKALPKTGKKTRGYMKE